jgi:hypothetical protein
MDFDGIERFFFHKIPGLCLVVLILQASKRLYFK